MQIYNESNLDTMRSMNDNSIDAIVCDPPYGINFMNLKFDYAIPSIDIWKECLRVLKPGGHLLAFSSTRTYHRMTCNIEDAGFEIRDMIAWLYGSGFPKSLNISKALDKKAFSNWLKDNPDKEKAYLEEIKDLDDYSEITIKYKKIAGLYKVIGKQYHPTSKDRTGNKSPFQAENSHLVGNYDITAPMSEKAKEYEGFGSSLKPAQEPVTLARKPLSEKTLADNVLKWGTGGINIDGCRVGTDDTITGSGKGFLDGKGFGTIGHGDKTNSDNGQHEKGRFPANIIHNGSEEVEEIFPESKGQQGDVKGTEPSDITKDIYGKFNSRQPSMKRNDSGSASRFFYCAKSSRSDRTNDGAVDNIHPTCKPTDLMQYLVRLVTPPNGTVYDPFMGSGTTGKASLLEGFDFIGSELEENYFNIAKARLENTVQFIKDPQSLVIEKKIKHIEKTMGMKTIFGRKKK